MTMKVSTWIYTCLRCQSGRTDFFLSLITRSVNEEFVYLIIRKHCLENYVIAYLHWSDALF